MLRSGGRFSRAHSGWAFQAARWLFTRGGAECSLQALRRFGQFRRIRLEPPLPVDQLVLAALEAQEVLGRWQVGHVHTVFGYRRLPLPAAAC